MECLLPDRGRVSTLRAVGAGLDSVSSRRSEKLAVIGRRLFVDARKTDDIIKYNSWRQTVIVKKLGGSVAVVIPKTIARDMDLTEGTPLELLSSPSGITLRKGRSRQRRSMKEIVAEIKANRCWEHNRDLVDDGGPVGREYW